MNLDEYVENDKLILNHVFINDDVLITKIIPYLNRHPNIKELELKFNEISEVGAIALASNQTLKSLTLRNNIIGATGAAALANNMFLENLDISGCKISDAGAIALAANTVLKRLHVAGNSIGDEGAKALAANLTLKYLDISYNLISDIGAEALALNQTLHELMITDNHVISPKGDALLGTFKYPVPSLLKLSWFACKKAQIPDNKLPVDLVGDEENIMPLFCQSVLL